MFVYASDLHLSLNTWRSLPEVREDSLISFKQLLDICSWYSKSENLVCPLVLGGDVFDSVKMTPELLTASLEIRNEYPDIPIYYINGNHDLIEPSWCSFWSNSYHLGAQPHTLPGGEVVCGIDFKLAEEFPDALSKVYPGCDYLVIHQTLDVLSSSLPGSLDSSPMNLFNCVLAGDYHKFVCYDPFYSAGSTNRRSIAEDGGKAFVIDDHNLHEFSLLNRPLVVVSADADVNATVSRVEIQKGQDFVKFIDKFDVKYDDPWEHYWYLKPLMKGIIVVRGEIDSDVKEYWTSEVNDRAYLLFVPEINAKDEITVDGATVAAARSSKAYLLDMLEQYPCSPEAKRMIQDYLAAPDKLIDKVREKLS